MKIYSIFLLSLLLLSLQGLHAQISIGVNAGASMSSFYYGQEKDQVILDFMKSGYTPGFAISVPIEFTLKGPFYLQTELNFLQKGTRLQYEDIEDAENYTKFESHSSLNYVQIPILIKVKTGTGDFRASIYAGPSISFLASGNYYSRLESLIMGNYISDESKDSIDLGEELNRWELSAIIGVGLELDAGPGALTVDARFHQGISSLVKDAEVTVRNQGFSAGFGYKINL